MAGANLEPFLLNCSLNDGSLKSMRIDPRLQQIQELDPGTGEVRSTIATYEPPAEFGGGTIDDSTVKITELEYTGISGCTGPSLWRNAILSSGRLWSIKVNERFSVTTGPTLMSRQ